MLRFLHLFLISVLFSSLAHAQRSKQSFPSAAPFEKSQYWLGLKAGISLSQATPIERFTVFEPIDGNYDGYKKEYETFNRIGTQYQFSFLYAYRRFSIYACPGYKSVKYSYKNKYTWQDVDNPSARVELNHLQIQTIEYATLPVTLKFEFLNTKLRPYLHGGGYVAYRFNGRKTLEVSGTDNASGGAGSFENQPIVVGSSSLYNTWWYGLMGGIGANYDWYNVRIFLEANYIYGINNVTNKATRYKENALSGSGDVLDDVLLSNLEFNLGMVFPMRFLNKGSYSSVKPR